jgi:predicted amino acid racemase
VTAPRLEIALAAITGNTRALVDLLSAQGIQVTGVTKAALADPAVATAMLAGGALGLGDSRVANLSRLRAAAVPGPRTLIRSPMLSQVGAVVREADVSLNTEPVVLEALAIAALEQGREHGVILMVELGDLREGLAASDVVAVSATVAKRPGLRLLGLGTNLACQCGVVPDQAKMDELTRLVEQVEQACGVQLPLVSGGNSANLDWALASGRAGRVNDLRLGEAILLGTEPLHRRPIDGLRTDAVTLVAEVIEAKLKPAQPWGELAQGAFGRPAARRGTGLLRQAILAIGRQDVDPDGLRPPPGMDLLGMSSDHLVLDVGDHDVAVGDELRFGLDYSGLLRAMTSPFLARVFV